MRRPCIFFLFLALLWPGAAWAQAPGSVAGTVTSAASGEPLPGVNVLIEGTQLGTATDAQGHYTIDEVEPGTYTVRASFIGYGDETEENVEVTAGDSTVVDLVMQQSVSGLDEVVVVGYGTQQRKDLTGSVGSIAAAEEAEVQTLTNTAQLLQGRVPGLNAGVATGADGESSLQVRGQNSIQAGNDPLIVVDGATFFGSLSDINPNDIESIDVLKGASAAAVYGASAAAGVIEVTTKTGTSPEPTISFKTSLGMARRGQYAVPYGPEEYVLYRQDAAIRDDPAAAEHFYADPRNLPSGITLEEWKALGTGGGEPVEIFLSRIGLRENEIQNYMEGKTIDWYEQVNRDAALRQNYNVSVSGNPQAVSYYLSLGYVDNQAQTVGGRFRTVRARANLTSNVTDWLEVSLRSQYANRNEGFLAASAAQAANVSPLGDKYAEDGTLMWYPHGDGTAQNPFLWTAESGREYEWRNNNLLGSLNADVDLPLGFGYQVRWSNDLNFRRNYLFNPSTTPFGEPAGEASRQEQTDYRWQVDNILTWDQTFGGIHAFETTFLFNVEAENIWITTSSNDQFPLETLGYGGLPLGGNPVVGNDDLRATGTALMGRLNYRLLDRYLLTVSYRRDGYSAFGQSHPYAYFPSAALAWRLSEEPFFGVDAVSNLKLRLSWGKNGNREIGTYAALQRLNAGKYIYDTQTVTTISSSNLPNPNLQWETTTQYNAGMDFGLFDGRVSGSVDAYYMSTENLLLQRGLPEVTGYTGVWSNLGEVVNRGLELSLNSLNVQGETFNWNSSLTFSMNRNEIKALYGDGEDDRENGWFIGHSLNEIYDYEILGVWQQDQAEAAAEYGREPGDFRLRDVNGDGVLSPVEDKIFQGYTEPRYRIGVSNDVEYKRFTLSALLTSHLGQFTQHNVHQHSHYSYGRHNQLDYPYWTPGNPTSEWARLSSEVNPVFNYWERSSFVRLQNVSLAYRLPESLTGRVGAERLSVFFNARNVGALTPFDGNDPETNELTPRLYSLGVNMSF